MTEQRVATLGSHGAAVGAALAGLREDRVVERIWQGDHTVWKPEPGEISNRLGWLRVMEEMRTALPEISALVEEVRGQGFTRALLLGMGGSSLAPEVFRNVFGVREGYLDLAVLDSTDPGAVLDREQELDFSRTLFVVSTKSGGTVETFSFFKHFYNQVTEEVGDEAGNRFVAITDPGSGLAETAERYDFRKTFLNDPEIGGRYSALSHFGLVPAALIGVDVPALLDRAEEMARRCGRDENPPPDENPGAWLGAVIGELAATGHDKLTLLADPPLGTFSVWIEQLVAESTGKEETGVLPIAGEEPAPPEVYGNDRLFVYLGLEGREGDLLSAAEELALAGEPVVRLRLRDPYDLGGEMFRWEMATAVAGRRLGINPFDQPDVEVAKKLARSMVEAYREEGSLPEPEPTSSSGDVTVYATGEAESPEEALDALLASGAPGDYVALQAYLWPTEETTTALQRLRLRLRERTGLATTLGYDPRFLHSTGQIHKGDAGGGMFVQITANPSQDVPIPNEAGAPGSVLSFGVLEKAQALGDGQALRDRQRRLVRLHITGDIIGVIDRLSERET